MIKISNSKIEVLYCSINSVSFQFMPILNLKKNSPIIYIGLLFFLLASCSQKKEDALVIATAANMQFAMQKLTSTFSKNTGIECQIIVSSSGKLTAQIKEGAPYDILVSADMKYPNQLFKEGFTHTKPSIYAYGKLILWTMDSETSPSFEILTQENITHIAVANPKTAPYGIAAKEVLLKEGFLPQIENKLVYGESIAQTNQFITTQAAEIGLTAMSVVLSPKMKEKGKWIAVDENSYTPISQGIVILKNNETKLRYSENFYNFLLSKEGQHILKTFGYASVN